MLLKVVMAILLNILGQIPRSYTIPSPASDYHMSDEFIEFINSQNSTWVAKKTFHKDTPLSYFEKICGHKVNLEARNSLPIVGHESNVELPDSFDSRDKWGSICPSLNEIRDQGHCGSCWAFSGVETVTDRTCIHSNGSVQFHASAENIVSCCTECGDGCQGGDETTVLVHWKKHGIVTGGPYKSQQGCQPYELPPCLNTNPCLSTEFLPTPQCRKTCEKGYNKTYTEDLHFGGSVYLLKTTNNIQADIMKNGPVTAAFVVYTDFIHYHEGVYQHLKGSRLGGHAVKIIGWGVEKKTPYWLIANSWNTTWGGLGGFFKILRGSNECGIEEACSSGLPNDYEENISVRMNK